MPFLTTSAAILQHDKILRKRKNRDWVPKTNIQIPQTDAHAATDLHRKDPPLIQYLAPGNEYETVRKESLNQGKAVVDLRDANVQVEPVLYPVPAQDEIILMVRDCPYTSVIDACRFSYKWPAAGTTNTVLQRFRIGTGIIQRCNHGAHEFCLLRQKNHGPRVGRVPRTHSDKSV